MVTTPPLNATKRNFDIPAIQDLKPGQQWVCFNEEKMPISPVTLKGVSGDLVEGNTDWASYDEAVKAWKANSLWLKGVGREFIEAQWITGIDLDKCVVDEQIAEWAQAIIDRLNSYTEYSPSRTGVHIWTRASIPDNLVPDKPAPDGIEMYDHGRYFTVTGYHVPATPTTIEARQEQVEALYREVRTARQQRKTSEQRITQEKARSPRTADTPYGLAALQKECQAVATTFEGARNDQLNRSSYSLGQLIAGSELSRFTVEDELLAAAERTGLGAREAMRTMRSGLEAGLLEPRSAPKLADYKPDTPTSSNGNGNGNHADGASGAGQAHKPFNRTDFGNAERLVARHGHDLRYCHSMNNWLVWNETHWQEDKDGHAERLAKDTVRSIYGEAERTADDTVRKALGAHAMRSESKKSIRDMLILAQSEKGIPIRREDLDGDPWLLNCANGTIDLRIGTLREHRRGDLLTKCLTIAYDPAATCPLFHSFLNTIFSGNAELIAFVKKALGYALTGDTSEQCFFLLYGKGHNGKSTLLEVIQAILSDYAQSAEFKAFLARDNEGIRNDIARMNGKRLVIAKESDKGKRLAEALVKQLTGGDTVTARFLHQEYFDFRPQFKLFLAANHKPEIKGTDLGIWRRVRLIPFTVTISESQKDKDLPKKLAQEAPGILAWLVEGCLEWQRDGLGMPEEVRTATESYREEMDVIAQFLSERCKVGNEVGATALYQDYKAWCEENGERYETQTKFGSRLAERGYEKSRNSEGRITYHGLELLPKGSEQSEQSEGFFGNSSRGAENVEKPQKSVQNYSDPSDCSEIDAKAFIEQFCSQPGYSLRLNEDGQVAIVVPPSMSDAEFETIRAKVEANEEAIREALRQQAQV